MKKLIFITMMTSFIIISSSANAIGIISIQAQKAIYSTHNVWPDLDRGNYHSNSCSLSKSWSEIYEGFFSQKDYFLLANEEKHILIQEPQESQESEETEMPSIYDQEDIPNNLRRVGIGYGFQSCSQAKIVKKEEIKSKAWPKIMSSCGMFTMGLMNTFNDNPNVIYSLCISGALEGCQRQLGITPPCEGFIRCRHSLGVP